MHADSRTAAVGLVFGVVYPVIIGVAGASPAATFGLIAINLTAAGMLLLGAPRLRRGGPWAAFFGISLPLLLFYLYYREAGIALGQGTVRWRDATVAALEWSWWVQRAQAGAGSPLVEELCALAYMLYVPLLLGVTVALMRTGQTGRAMADDFVRRVCLAWAGCYVLFLVVPTLGPRFVFPGIQSARFGAMPFSAVARLNQDHGMIQGAAFPSAHVAAGLLSVLAVRTLRPVFIGAVMVFLGLSAGAIYLGYHYVIDVVTGAGVAVAAYAVDRACLGGGSGREGGQ